MAFYRLNDDNDEEELDSLEVKKVKLSSFEELPPEIYKELVNRSLHIAKRLRERSTKLHEALAEHVEIAEGGDLEEAYWRTACVEQMAFFEMQIGNIHDFLQKLISGE